MRARLALTAIVALLPVTALAHTGHGQTGFAAGIAHPVGGIDHLLAMVAVGLWAALAGGAARWAAPAAFLAAMQVGAALGLAGLPVPAVEPAIVASVMVLGAAVALASVPSLGLALPVIALFGLVHGAAHGIEAPKGGLGGYALGFLMATAGLLLGGLALGSGLPRMPVRIAGAAVLALGAGLAVSA